MNKNDKTNRKITKNETKIKIKTENIKTKANLKY